MAHRNVILILTDQQRFDTLGCNGSTVARTPNLDRLAVGGVNFGNHIVANPVCSPSRGCIMTGRHTTEHGLWANGCTLPRHEITMPMTMHRHGFQTAHFGKLHLEPILNRVNPPHAYGFEVAEIAEGDQMLTHDAYFSWLRQKSPDLFVKYLTEMYEKGHANGYTSGLPEELHLSRWITDRSIDYLQNRRRDEQPFFLSMGYFDPHHAFNPVEPYAGEFANVDVPPPLFDEAGLASKPPHYQAAAKGMSKITRDLEQILRVRQAYHAMCAHIDVCIGRLLETLTFLGLADDTVVLFSADHGELLGEHGLLWKGPFLLDELLRVPMIAAIPGRPLGSGVKVDSVTSAVDLMATVQSVAGIEPDAVLSGSGRPMLDADLSPLPQGPRDYALCEWENDKNNNPDSSLRCLRTATHKLVHYNLADDGELYDLLADPREVTNLFHDPGFAEVRKDLERQLQSHYLSRRPPTLRTAGW